MSVMAMFRQQSFSDAANASAKDAGCRKSMQGCQKGSQFAQHVRFIREEYEMVRTP
jgi:hypothetical protein